VFKKHISRSKYYLESNVNVANKSKDEFTIDVDRLKALRKETQERRNKFGIHHSPSIKKKINNDISV